MWNSYKVTFHRYVTAFLQSILFVVFFVQPAMADGENSPFSDPTLSIRLYSKTANAPNVFNDEVMIYFANNYSNGIDNNDVVKTNYSTNNLAILKNGSQLSTEKRKPLTTNDTVFLQLSNTSIADYSFQILPNQLDNNLYLQAFIKDRYLLTETQVSFSTTTNIDFTINNDPASKAADRFYIFLRPFIPAGPLSVTFLSMAAMINADKTTSINWKVAIEVNLEHYQTEKSSSPFNFTQFGNNILPTGGGNAASYTQTDNNLLKGLNYYRIKATSTNGQIHYSNIVKVDLVEKNNSITIFPNPTTGNNLNLRFNEMAGKYQYNIINNVGQVITSGNMQVAKAVVEKNIIFNTIIPPGIYRMIMVNENGKNYSVSFNMQ